MQYIRTFPGILKIIQIFFSFICFISTQCSSVRHDIRGQSLTGISAISFCYALIMLLLYLSYTVEKSPRFPWLYMEFVISSLLGLSFPVASVFAATFNESLYLQQQLLLTGNMNSVEEQRKIGAELVAIILKPTSNASVHVAITFGLLVTFVYAVDAYSKWLGARSGTPAQGTRKQSTNTGPSGNGRV